MDFIEGLVSAGDFEYVQPLGDAAEGTSEGVFGVVPKTDGEERTEFLVVFAADTTHLSRGLRLRPPVTKYESKGQIQWKFRFELKFETVSSPNVTSSSNLNLIP